MKKQSENNEIIEMDQELRHLYIDKLYEMYNGFIESFRDNKNNPDWKDVEISLFYEVVDMFSTTIHWDTTRFLVEDYIRAARKVIEREKLMNELLGGD